MAITGEKVRRELLIWVGYLFISLIAAIAIHAIFESANSNIEVSDGDAGVAVNFQEMLLSLWYEHYRWCLVIFVILSAVRLFILFAPNRVSRSFKLK